MCPAPSPAITSPNSGSSTTRLNLGYLPVTVQNRNFVPASGAMWNGQRLDGQQATGGGGYVNAGRMTIRMLESALMRGHSDFLSVVNTDFALAGFGDKRSNVLRLRQPERRGN